MYIEKPENEDFMVRADISDLDKLMLDFEFHKDALKSAFPQLYYCLLAIKDKYKTGYKLLNPKVFEQEPMAPSYDPLHDCGLECSATYRQPKYFST